MNISCENWIVQRVIVFLSCFVYLGLDFLWLTWRVFLEKERMLTLPVDSTPGPCSQFLGESELLIYFCYFVCIIWVNLCSLLCLSIFHVWSLSLVARPRITFFWFLQNLGTIVYSFKSTAIYFLKESRSLSALKCLCCGLEIQVLFSKPVWKIYPSISWKPAI